MDTKDRIKAFTELGNWLREISEDEFQSITDHVKRENPWFTEENVRLAFNGIVNFLSEEALAKWIRNYSLNGKYKIALVLAGNIPLVGFHDLLAVLLSGNSALLKLSSKDSYLTTYLIKKLTALEPRFESCIKFAERLKDFDAIIATGSDNSARYFEYYFSKYPHIIRKNRTSVAILDGTETTDELYALGKDVFSYYGLGCRNVSKLFVPVGYNFSTMFPSWEVFKDIIHHHKYCNNYDYQKSIMLVNRVPFLDNGFVMIHETERLVSPISVLHYEYYSSSDDLSTKLSKVNNKIQCTVGKHPLATVNFGEAQCPGLTDYADGVDTLEFISGLSKDKEVVTK